MPNVRAKGFSFGRAATLPLTVCPQVSRRVLKLLHLLKLFIGLLLKTKKVSIAKPLCNA